jgi:hypothetical protein
VHAGSTYCPAELVHWTCPAAGGAQYHVSDVHVQNDWESVYTPTPHEIQTSGAPGHPVPSG